MKKITLSPSQHFIDLLDIDATTLRALLDEARAIKQARKAGRKHAMLKDKKLAMIFEKHSTRTRVSFEAGMLELGGHALNLTSNDLQLGRGESIADTARVLSRYVNGIMMRANDHNSLLELAHYAEVPVINGLTDRCHPCQVMADLLTFEEQRGNIRGATVVWIGDGNNVCNSWISAAIRFGFHLRIACPPALMPGSAYLEAATREKAGVTVIESPQDAVQDADAVITDTWVSMGTETSETRKHMLRPYQVDDALMAKAGKDALFFHCLPAHRGEEVTAGVIDGPASVVWDEAENRLHAQKSILLWCMRG